MLYQKRKTELKSTLDKLNTELCEHEALLCRYEVLESLLAATKTKCATLETAASETKPQYERKIDEINTELKKNLTQAQQRLTEIPVIKQEVEQLEAFERQKQKYQRQSREQDMKITELKRKLEEQTQTSAATEAKLLKLEAEHRELSAATAMYVEMESKVIIRSRDRIAELRSKFDNIEKVLLACCETCKDGTYICAICCNSKYSPIKYKYWDPASDVSNENNFYGHIGRLHSPNVCPFCNGVTTDITLPRGNRHYNTN